MKSAKFKDSWSWIHCSYFTEIGAIGQEIFKSLKSFENSSVSGLFFTMTVKNMEGGKQQ